MPTNYIDNPNTWERGYTYRADHYCAPCAIRVLLAREGLEGHGLSHIAQDAIDRLSVSYLGAKWIEQDEYQWDTDDWPKILTREMVQNEECRCGSCGVIIA